MAGGARSAPLEEVEKVSTNRRVQRRRAGVRSGRWSAGVERDGYGVDHAVAGSVGIRTLDVLGGAPRSDARGLRCSSR
jgi:hypothetical protein